jgi:hypothetical protein
MNKNGLRLRPAEQYCAGEINSHTVSLDEGIFRSLLFR